MPKAIEPLLINFFATGLYTHRSALFSPYRPIGVNVVTYHDAVIDGQDMEIGSSLQWKRRPGFARFCSVPFQTGEFPLQFYSARQPAGTVTAFVDTNQHFSTFTPTSLTPIISKNTTAQGFIQQVGQMTYYADGVDLQKWDGTRTSAWGIAAPASAPTTTLKISQPSYWVANSSYSLGQIWIVDYNGNIQYAPPLVDGSTRITGVAEPNWNATPGGVTIDGGNGVGLGPVIWTNLGPYSGAIWAASTAVKVSAVLIDSNGNLQQANTNGTTGATQPAWNAAIGGSTTDNTVTWFNRGPGTLSVQSGYTYAYGFRTIYGQLSTLSALLTVGAVMGPLSIPLAGTGVGDPQCSQALTITQAGILNNVLTIYYTPAAGQSVLPGQSYKFSAVVNRTFLNGQTVYVSTAAVVNGIHLFTATYNAANSASSGEGGTATFQPIEIYRTADGGGILYFDAAITNPGAAWTYTDTTPDTNLATSVIGPIAHLNDPPPGTPGSLVTQGGTILTYWQGRIWMAVGNKLYFDAGPDCINGVPEESWPPANVFQYPGPITGLSPTSQGLLVWGADYLSMALGGPQTLSFFPYDLMKNFGVSSSNCIAQDGDTISILTTQGQCFTLDASGKAETGAYIVDQLSGFSPASSYITIHRNGTDAGLWLADGDDTAFRYSLNIGAWATKAVPVGGIGALRSIETSAGVMTLCAGRATGGGYILGRSLTTWQDDGQNYPSAFVTIGSIVLTPLGSRLIPVEHIDGYFDAVGSLGPRYVNGQAVAPTGGPTVPTIAILPNEISAGAGPGFLTLGQPKSLYTTTQLQTSSLLSLRWDIDSMSVQSLVSQLMHHVQVRISWPPENAPNSVKSIAILFEKE